MPPSNERTGAKRKARAAAMPRAEASRKKTRVAGSPKAAAPASATEQPAGASPVTLVGALVAGMTSLAGRAPPPPRPSPPAVSSPSATSSSSDSPPSPSAFPSAFMVTRHMCSGSGGKVFIHPRTDHLIVHDIDCDAGLGFCERSIADCVIDIACNGENPSAAILKAALGFANAVVLPAWAYEIAGAKLAIHAGETPPVLDQLHRLGSFFETHDGCYLLLMFCIKRIRTAAGCPVVQGDFERALEAARRWDRAQEQKECDPRQVFSDTAGDDTHSGGGDDDEEQSMDATARAQQAPLTQSPRASPFSAATSTDDESETDSEADMRLEDTSDEPFYRKRAASPQATPRLLKKAKCGTEGKPRGDDHHETPFRFSMDGGSSALAEDRGAPLEIDSLGSLPDIDATDGFDSESLELMIDLARVQRAA